MSSRLETVTPTLPPKYEPGQVLKLYPLLHIEEENGDTAIFKTGVTVTIVAVRHTLTTGSTKPITSATASYKIVTKKTVLTEVTGEPIRSRRVQHDDLLEEATRKPGSSLYKTGQTVIMKNDTQFPRIPTVKAGTKVIIDAAGATTNKGSTMVRGIKDAYYQISPVNIVPVEREYKADRHVSHNELREA